MQGRGPTTKVGSAALPEHAPCQHPEVLSREELVAHGNPLAIVRPNRIHYVECMLCEHRWVEVTSADAPRNGFSPDERDTEP
jgi:hypothetical protein